MVRIGMAVVCALVALAGCGGEKAGLAGTWEASLPDAKGVSVVFTFTADGKYSQETVIEGLEKAPNVTVDGGKQEGTYKQDGKTLTLTTGGTDKTVTVKEHTADKLVLVSGEGKEISLSKKK